MDVLFLVAVSESSPCQTLMVKVSKCQKYLVNSSPHCLWNEIGKLLFLLIIIILVSQPVRQLAEEDCESQAWRLGRA